MAIKPYKQSLSHSCLAASFLMLLSKQQGIKSTEKNEQEVTFSGSRREHSFYAAGITIEIVKKYKNNVRVIVDNAFFARISKKTFRKEKRISVEVRRVTLKLISELLEENVLICHIDSHALGDYSHASHFIVLEKMGKTTFTIIDPWVGKRRVITHSVLKRAIFELRTHIKMCPLLFLSSKIPL